MKEESTLNQSWSRARSKLKKLAIALAIFCGLFLVIGLGMGIFLSFLLHTPTPEIVLKIEAEHTNRSRNLAEVPSVIKNDGLRNEGLASTSVPTSKSLNRSVTHLSGEPTSVAAAGQATGTLNLLAEPLFPLRSDLTPQQKQERECINAIYQQCLAGFEECMQWDQLSYHERKKKLSEIFKIQQANLRPFTKQVDIESEWRVKNDNSEAYHSFLRIYERYGELLNIHHRLSLENAVRHQQWYEAARLSNSRVIDPDMIYYFRRVNTKGYIKFSWITGTIWSRGYNSLRMSNRILLETLP